MQRSASGESGLEFGVRPFTLQGNDAWPGDEYFRGPHRPEPSQKATVGKVGKGGSNKAASLTPFAEGFVRGCKEAGLDSAQTAGQAAGVLAVFPELGEDLAGVVKTADGFLGIPSLFNTAGRAYRGGKALLASGAVPSRIMQKDRAMRQAARVVADPAANASAYKHYLGRYFTSGPGGGPKEDLLDDAARWYGRFAGGTGLLAGAGAAAPSVPVWGKPALTLANKALVPAAVGTGMAEMAQQGIPSATHRGVPLSVPETRIAPSAWVASLRTPAERAMIDASFAREERMRKLVKTLPPEAQREFAVQAAQFEAATQGLQDTPEYHQSRRQNMDRLAEWFDAQRPRWQQMAPVRYDPAAFQNNPEAVAVYKQVLDRDLADLDTQSLAPADRASEEARIRSHAAAQVSRAFGIPPQTSPEATTSPQGQGQRRIPTLAEIEGRAAPGGATPAVPPTLAAVGKGLLSGTGQTIADAGQGFVQGLAAAQLPAGTPQPGQPAAQPPAEPLTLDELPQSLGQPGQPGAQPPGAPSPMPAAGKLALSGTALAAGVQQAMAAVQNPVQALTARPEIRALVASGKLPLPGVAGLVQDATGHLNTALKKLSGGHVDLTTAAGAVAKDPSLLQTGWSQLMSSLPAAVRPKVEAAMQAGDGSGALAALNKLEGQPGGRIGQFMAEKLGLGDWWYGLGKPQQWLVLLAIGSLLMGAMGMLFGQTGLGGAGLGAGLVMGGLGAFGHKLPGRIGEWFAGKPAQPQQRMLNPQEIAAGAQ